MKSMVRGSMLIIVLSLSSLSYAVDIPTNVGGAEALDKARCINDNANDCIQSVCLTSSELDCTDKCWAAAKDKCAELQDED